MSGDSFFTDTAKISKIYNSGENELPPQELDNAIIAAAHDALCTNQVPRRSSIAWTLPVSLAAAVLLGASLIMFMQISTQLDAQHHSIARVASPNATPSVIANQTTTLAHSSSDNAALEQTGDSAALVELSSLQTQATSEITNADTASARAGNSADNNSGLARRLALPEPVWTLDLMENPGAWLDYIELLRLKARLEEARTHLQAFRRRYPETTLPDSLSKLVPLGTDGL